ncbi:MAG: class I SAM-dependent methyltransferase [Halorhabdus sp.]
MPDDAFNSFFASHYDDLYDEKDYEGEVNYVIDLFDRYDRTVESVLDIGCGSGNHAVELVDRGFAVHGIDKSLEMVRVAREKIDRQRGDAPISIERSSIEDFVTDETFDAAIAQFNVFGYITETAAFMAALRSVRNALDNDGVFVFDTWYGPAVLDIKPETRYRKVTVEEGTIHRIATPSLDPERNMVELTYDMLQVDGNIVLSNERESHPIRYYFQPEIELLLEQAGFSLHDVHEYKDPESEIGLDTWSVTWVALPS